MDDLDLYEDEPMTSVRPKEFSGNQMVIENMDEVERKRQKRRRRRKKRLERLGKLAVCVCCAGAIAAIIVTIVVTEAAIAVTSPVPPTVGPTPMPAMPTYKPTVARPTMKIPKPTTKPPSVASPTMHSRGPTTAAPTFSVVDSYELVATQDTYIVTKGPNLASTHGKQETMLVQTGFRTNDNDQDTVALLIFDTTRIPTFDNFATEGKKAVLKLYHKPLDVIQQSREPAPITISRMDATPLMIETLSGANYQPKGWWDGPTVKVPLDATEVSFDITDLVFNTAFNQNQLFLMLQTRNQEQKDGDLFYARESEKPPLLFLSGLKP